MIGPRISTSLFIVPLVLLAGCATGTATRRTAWTILCLETEDSVRALDFERVADSLKRTKGIRANAVEIVRNPDGSSRLRYGEYYLVIDPETGRIGPPRRMKEDLLLIRQLGDDGGRRFFRGAIPVRLQSLISDSLPDVGNPEWALQNVRAMYSLQVAVFEPTKAVPDYKTVAAEFCKLLRAEGYEAYYYHASASSMVTVGTFGPDAVRNRAVGDTRYSVEVRNLQKHELLKYNLMNGGILRVRSSGGEMIPVSSALVLVPHRADSDFP